MHCCTSKRPQSDRTGPRRASGAGLWVQLLAYMLAGLVTWCSLGVVHAQAAGVEMQQMRLERNEDGVFLSGQVKFELPAIVEDALRKGIPMFFVAEAEILRSRWYWSDDSVASSARHTRLAYQPLTRRWRLNTSPNPIGSSGLGVTLNQTFDELPEALAAIQRISRWKIADAPAVATDGRYRMEFQFRLDTSQLPRPFQIGVAGRADWDLAGTYRMPLPPVGE